LLPCFLASLLPCFTHLSTLVLQVVETALPQQVASVAELPWEGYDPIIEKDTAALLDVSLASKLAFQRLKNVFQVREARVESSEPPPATAAAAGARLAPARA
jgi:hypothetical protein